MEQPDLDCAAARRQAVSRCKTASEITVARSRRVGSRGRFPVIPAAHRVLPRYADIRSWEETGGQRAVGFACGERCDARERAKCQVYLRGR